MSFKFKNLDRMHGQTVTVSIPNDEDGFLGRECPKSECKGYFKIKPGTGLTGPDLKCHCPYCGSPGDSSEFNTEEQLEYAKSVVVRQAMAALTQDLKQLELRHPPRGSFGIGLSLKVEVGQPIPLHQYREKALETHVTCSDCTLEYAIYGVFGYCSDCRVHNSLQILARNQELIAKQIALAQSLPEPDLARHLLEDALENCVSAFDGFGREACRVRAGMSSKPEKVSKISFQSLDDASAKLQELFGIALDTTIDLADWTTVHRVFMKRHLLAHRAGVVDAKYIAQTSDPQAVVGRRVSVVQAEIFEALRVTRALAEAMVRLLPAPV